MNRHRSLSDKITDSEDPNQRINFPGVSLIRIFRLFISGFLLIIIALSALNASQDNWRIVNYSLEQGLSQISVSSVIQDSNGFLWIGTRDGLNKFDGYGFNVYRHQPSNPLSLSGSNVHSVIEDKKGNIWAGTQDGLNKLDRKRNSFKVYRHEPGNLSSVSDNKIYYLYEDRAGMIWLKTERGIDRFDSGTGTFRHYQHYSDESNYVTGSGYYHIYEDHKERLWVGSKDGLFFFDRLAERFRRYSHDPDNPLSISNNKVKCIFETSGGHFLIGTAGGLNIFDRSNESFTPVHIDPPGAGHSLVNVINSIFEDSRGIVWLGTDAGLFTFTPENGQVMPFGGKAITGTFPDTEVSVIFEDHSNNLWVGSLGGLFMIDSKSKFAASRIHDYLPEAPSSSGLIASVFLSGDEELWIGTLGGGLFMLNRNTGGIKHYSVNSPYASQRISNDFVQVIFSDSNGRMIIGTRDGLDIYMGNQRGFKPFCPSNQAEECTVFNSNRVYRIFKDSQQVLWIGTGRGLHSFREGNMESYYHNPRDTVGIPSSQVHDILECRNGFIWLATAGGLSRFDRTTETFINYRKDPEKGRFSLSNNELTCLHEDSNGNLWVGSVAGLNRFFPGTGSFMVFSEKEGLPNNLIYSILEDNGGNLWLSTNHGLARFNPGSFEVTVFDVADGLLSYEFNSGAYLRSENGELFFGGVAGLNSFFPDSLVTNNVIPPVALTSFEVLSPEGSRFLLTEEREEIILQPHENSFIIEFAAMDFTRPSKNRYAYKLMGLEDNWIYTGSRRTVSFSRIPSGTYVLSVKGSNNDDVWNEEGVSLRIVIITPWWKSGYAYLLYAVSLLALVYLVIMFSTRKLRSTNQALREKELASEEISRQKEELAFKNRNITDSIIYAKRIQLAMMPTSKQFRRIFPDSFVYYNPKDIVSGDFYWVNQRSEKVFFAVIDCTGHGVPGAFMSIIGYELLRNIINIKGIENPAEILNELNEDFSGIFNSEEENNYSFRDGMDIGFCVIDCKKAILEYAGAFSSMYLLRDKSVSEIKGNRFSVGLMGDLIDEPFENHSMKLEKDDVIYLFSDGYPDQFGGEEGKKFKYRRFRHLLLNIHRLPFRQQEKILDQSLIHWMGNHEQVDDILIIGVKPGLCQ